MLYSTLYRVTQTSLNKAKKDISNTYHELSWKSTKLDGVCDILHIHYHWTHVTLVVLGTWNIDDGGTFIPYIARVGRILE